MKKSTILVLATLALTTAALTGCSTGSAREVEIVATEHKFEPATINVKPGEKIKFTVVNKGSEDHEFESDDAHIDEIVIPPGKSRSIEVTMPTKEGDFEFVCDAPGHLAAGMQGKIVVGK